MDGAESRIRGARALARAEENFEGVVGDRAARPDMMNWPYMVEQAEPPRFRAPAGLEFVRIPPESGLRAGPGCPGPRQPFLRGTAPDRQCTAEGWKTAMRGLRWLREQLPGGRSQADGARSE